MRRATAETRKAGKKAYHMDELAKMPELDVMNLNIISVHRSGRFNRWNLLTHTGARVGHVLRAVVQRTHATSDPLDENQVVLAEVLHGKIHRFFDEDMEIKRLREGDTLACYEVSHPEAFGVGQSTDIRDSLSPESPEPGSVCGIIVNVRQQSQRMYFKDESDSAGDCDIHGVPALFCVEQDCTGAKLYDTISEYFRHSNRKVPESSIADFQLFWCRAKAELMAGGTPIPLNADALPMKRSSRTDGGQWHLLLVAEWTAEDELPPWTMQQIGEEGVSLEERSLQIFVGVDMRTFVSQFQFLWDERRRLTTENQALMNWVGGKEDRIGKLRTKIRTLERTNMSGLGDSRSNAKQSSPVSREGESGADLAATLAQTQAALAHSQYENERLQEEVLMARKSREDINQVVLQQRVQIDKLGRELDALNRGWRSQSADSTWAPSPTPPPAGSGDNRTRSSQSSRMDRMDETPTPLAFQMTPTPGPEDRT